MISFDGLMRELMASGYTMPKARTKIAHDIVLMAMARSGFGKNVTVKGGVVMSDLTDDIRRATMDMDIDFVRYSLSNEKIDAFVQKLNCIEGVAIGRSGPIAELRQRNYKGKRIFLRLTDGEGVSVRTKVDIGVHVHARIRQQIRNFKVSVGRRGVKVPANAGEQVFAEKLKSLLRFGARSERPKDVFDMCYLVDVVNRRKLRTCLDALVFSDETMRERTPADIAARLSRTFGNRRYLAKLERADVNWLGLSPQMATERILAFIRSI